MTDSEKRQITLIVGVSTTILLVLPRPSSCWTSRH